MLTLEQYRDPKMAEQLTPEFYGSIFLLYTKNQLKTVQKIEHNLAYMDYAKIFCLQFYWLLLLQPL